MRTVFCPKEICRPSTRARRRSLSATGMPHENDISLPIAKLQGFVTKADTMSREDFLAGTHEADVSMFELAHNYEVTPGLSRTDEKRRPASGSFDRKRSCTDEQGPVLPKGARDTC